jgi:predicted amidophosphoribosyltransferase
MVSPSPVLGAARDLARLVLPVECPGCGRPDEILCPACAAVLAGPVRRCEDDVPRLDRMDGVPPLPVWTVTTYAGPVRGVVVAWKDRGRRDLTDRLVTAVEAAGEAVAGVLRASGLTGVSVPPGVVGGLRVVQVPTTSAARRRRGADLVGRLAEGVAAGLTRGGLPARATPVLRRRAAADQVGLGARARGRNSARVTLRPSSDPRRGLHLLVDDIVTTGATLAACCRAIEAAGGLVLGAIVIAATPPPAAHRTVRIERIRPDTPKRGGRHAAAVAT